MRTRGACGDSAPVVTDQHDNTNTVAALYVIRFLMTEAQVNKRADVLSANQLGMPAHSARE